LTVNERRKRNTFDEGILRFFFGRSGRPAGKGLETSKNSTFHGLFSVILLLSPRPPVNPPIPEVKPMTFGTVLFSGGAVSGGKMTDNNARFLPLNAVEF